MSVPDEPKPKLPPPRQTFEGDTALDKFRDWFGDRWYVIVFYLVAIVFRLGILFWGLTVVGILVAGGLALRYLRRRRIEQRANNWHQWKCEKCGYDLWGTPDHCPECGALSPFGEWLKQNPIEQAIYDGSLRPHREGETLPHKPAPPVEKVMETWPEFNTHAQRDVS